MKILEKLFPGDEKFDFNPFAEIKISNIYRLSYPEA